MEKFQKEFAEKLADSEALFFGKNLKLKDGRDTPYFVNLGCLLERTSSICQLGGYYGEVISYLVKNEKLTVDIISGPSYKGSLIAQAAATDLYQKHGMDVGFNYDRKEAKTHGEGSDKGTIFVGAKFYDNCNVLIVDDVGTSMKTKVDFIDKIRNEASALEAKVNISAVLIGIDREQLNKEREDAIAKFTENTKIPVFSILRIREVMQYFCENNKHIPFKQSDGSIKRVLVTKDFLDKHFNPYMERYMVKR